MTIRVLIVEPVVPHYRIALFDALAATGEFELCVAASRRSPGSPDSVSPAPPWADLEHSTVGLLRNRLFWQRNLSLPAGFGVGDVLVIDGNPRFVSNWPLFARARRRGVGVVCWGHGWSPTSKHWRASLRYRYMDLAQVILVYTDEEIRELKTIRSWRSSILATNNALDQAPLVRAAQAWPQERLTEFARSQGLANRKVILFCGRLRRTPSTELDVVLHALAQLSRQSDEYLLVVIGTGEAEHELREFSRSLGVERFVRWVGAIYDEENLAPWFLSALCFAYPGAIGLSLLHAFGYGLPVITHPVRKLHGPEIAALRDMENGMFFARGASADLAQKVAQLAADPALRQRLSAGAQRKVATEFSMCGMIDRFACALRLASQASRARAAQMTGEPACWP